MQLEFLSAKIHLATVTDANLRYEGSLTIDLDLMEAAGMRPNQKVLVSNCSNGNRFETYLIPGVRGKGDVCLNGSAAWLGKIGDEIIVMTFCLLAAEEAAKHSPTVVRADKHNRPARLLATM